MKLTKDFNFKWDIFFYEGVLIINNSLVINTNFNNINNFNNFDEIFKTVKNFFGFVYEIIKDQNYLAPFVDLKDFHYDNGNLVTFLNVEKNKIKKFLDNMRHDLELEALDTNLIIEEDNSPRNKNECYHVFADSDGFFLIHQGLLRLATNIFHLEKFRKKHQNCYFQHIQDGLCWRDRQDFYFFIKRINSYTPIYHIIKKTFNNQTHHLYFPGNHSKTTTCGDLRKLKKNIFGLK